MRMQTFRGPFVALTLSAVALLAGCAMFSNKPPGSATAASPIAATASVTLASAASASTTEPAPPEATNNAPVVSFQPIVNLPAPPENLWAMLRKNFSLPDGNEHRVEVQLAWYRNHPGYMVRTATRAQPYLYYIVQQLKKRHMPLDLALLPVVESAYDPFAYSYGRAAGLWQFIPSTGRLYGLHQNWWYDGRRDIVGSTNAALDYLQSLHDKFDSWLLALAAYNSGGGTVEAAIRYNKRHGRATDFWHLNLPLQTRNYVPRLLAVRDLILDSSKYGITLPTIPDSPYLA
ncbi:MAG: transglycosylase SLT domain-containing protein, partial [Gammaproteobacteria bacterium]